MKKLLSILVAMIITLPAMATIDKVTITVTDADYNEPIPGAKVAPSNTQATITNNDGNAILNNVPDNATITISATGYETQTLTAAKTLNVKMRLDNNQMSQVTVTGCDASQSIPENGIKKQKVVDGKCVPAECYEPCYKLENDECVPQTIDGGTYKLNYDNQSPKCELTCDKNAGYELTDDELSCVKETKEAQAEPEPKSEPEPTAPDDNKSVNGTKCAKKDRPENSTKSHRYYDETTKKILCLVDKCKNGYKPSNDLLSCIVESALSEADAKKRMDELKQNAADMKAKEQSDANKLLGAAGIASVGIGGMMTASALSEKSADKDAEQDMKAYLATFRCDYGQGRNIMGGETGVQLPNASQLSGLKAEYTSLATELKATKAALNMRPGIESELVLNSAETGLYDDVGIGSQKGAFTSLARALMDENSADAAEWKSQKDSTAKKLKTGAAIAGIGAVGTLAGNLIVNKGKGNDSASILDSFKDKKEPIKDLTLERVPCSKYSDTNGAGYVPDCTCGTTNSYFAENERKCIQCDATEHVENKTCVCNTGYHHDTNKNCVVDTPGQTCTGLTGVSGGTYPDCTCTDTNATFDKDERQCITNDVTPAPKTDQSPANSQTTNPIAAIFSGNNKGTDPIVGVNLSADTTFNIGQYGVDDKKCNEIINKIKTDTDIGYSAVQDSTSDLCISVVGHTDTKWFSRKTVSAHTLAANEAQNIELSKERAINVSNCLAKHIGKDLFPKVKNKTTQTDGKGWSECPVKKRDTVTDACRRVEIKIYTNSCPKQ